MRWNCVFRWAIVRSFLAYEEFESRNLEAVMTSEQLSQSAGSAEAALRERIKELTCLYGIAQIASTSGH